MELELKHIAPYLPYGLKFQYESKDENWMNKKYTEVLSGVRKDESGDNTVEIQLASHGWATFEFRPDYKPILRPLSELKDDVKFRQLLVDQLNDETFKLHYVDDVKQLSLITSSGHRELIYLMNEVCGECSYMIYQFMVENKFDLFNLIPQGLAVDSTTLK